MREVQEAQAELRGGVAAINALWDDMPKLNKAMADAGMQYFRVELSNAPPQTFGRGGGN
jgi:hypothetical protein